MSLSTIFGEQISAEYTPDISINPTYGLTTLRQLTTTANGGAVSEDAGSFRLRTGTTANASAAIQTAERGDYTSGSQCLAGILVYRPTKPTGNQVLRWGYFDGDDGFYVEEDAERLRVVVKRGGSVVQSVPQREWTEDSLDGYGPSRLNVDLTKPTIFRFLTALYGEGPTDLYVLAFDSQGNPEYTKANTIGPEASTLLLEKWGLPVRAEADNGGDTTSIDLNVGGMQFGTLGRRVRKPRTPGETVLSKSLSGTTLVPVATFRKKASDEQKNVRVEGVTMLSADDLYYQVVLNGTLTGASYGSLANVSGDETAVEVDTSATAISGGEAIYEDVQAGGGGNKLESPGRITLGNPIPNGQTVTLAVRKISGTGGSGTFTFRVSEDW